MNVMNQPPQFESHRCNGESSWQHLESACAWCSPTRHLTEPPLVGAAGLPITHVLCDSCSAQLMSAIPKPRDLAA